MKLSIVVYVCYVCAFFIFSFIMDMAYISLVAEVKIVTMVSSPD
jgi:hypothetical protein